MMGSLAGRTVWITRLQGEDLCDLVREHGGMAEALPVLEITAAPGPPEPLTTPLGAADALVFVSRNAVKWTMRLVPAALLDELYTRPCYCPGQETAGLLRASGFQEVHPALENRGSEGLLELPGLGAQRVAGRSIIIFRGMGGRRLLGQELKMRGAQVKYIEVYRRTHREYGAGELSRLYATRRPDCVEVSSRDGLHSLRNLLQRALDEIPASLRVVVPAPRLLGDCAALGFQHPVLAQNATNQALLDGFLVACQAPGAEGTA